MRRLLMLCVAQDAGSPDFCHNDSTRGGARAADIMVSFSECCSIRMQYAMLLTRHAVRAAQLLSYATPHHDGFEHVPLRVYK